MGERSPYKCCGGLAEASKDGFRVSSGIYDSRDDDATRFDGVEDTERETGNKQPAVTPVEARSAFGKTAELIKSGVQVAQKDRSTALLIILVVFKCRLDVEVSGKQQDEFAHAPPAE